MLFGSLPQRRSHWKQCGIPARREVQPQPSRMRSAVTRDWIQELIDRGETELDAHASAAQIQVDKMITLATDGEARASPQPAGWGVLVRRNGKFLCQWKHYPRGSNNVMS
jgi:hypothetical protein